MDLVIKTLTVFGLGILEIFAAVPAGFLLALDPLIIFSASCLGGIAGVVWVAFVGGRIRRWLLRIRGGEGKSKGPGRARRIWERYGVVGFGLAGPILFGAPLCAALGIALGGDGKRVSLWVSLGVIMWSAILTAGMALGIFSAALLF